MKFELLMEGPYDLTRCAWAFCHFPQDGTDVWIPPRETLPAEYHRLHIVEDEPILIRVQQEFGSKDDQARLIVRTHPEHVRNVSLLKERVRWQFHVDASLEGFYQRARKHPFLRPLIKALYGVKPIRPSTVFEMDVIALSEQQISLNAAIQIRSRLVRALGKKVLVEGKEYRAFPTPKTLTGRTVHIGSIQPFSFNDQLIVLADPLIRENEEVVFNAGRLDRSIFMKMEDYFRIARPQLVEIAIRTPQAG